MLQLKHFLCLFLALLFCQSAWAQQTISGRVTDATDGSALIGVNIVAKSTRRNVVSDASGNFSIIVKPDETLEVSYVGYENQNVAVNNRSRVDIQLVSSAAQLDQVVVVGTRRPGRVKLETPVPVDVVNVRQVTLPTARMDLTSIINYTAPSFNYSKQSGSDGADHIDLATLRGLGPDQSLVLINGKRRHQTAFVAVFGTRGRGNSGTDLNSFPAAAIERVEILRDGASAQYGSDAIAGVINIVMKKTRKQLSANVGYSTYYDKDFNPYFKKEYNQYVHSGKPFDGNTFAADVSYGIPVGDNGVVNVTLNYANIGKTYRQTLDTTATGEYGIPYFNTVRRAHGDGSLNAYGAFFNADIPFANSKTSFYAFGGYNRKESDAYAYTRNFSARPQRFVTDANGELIPSAIIQTAGDGERYFNPHIQTNIDDLSLAAGVKGEFANGWGWDVSNTVGKNNFHFYGDKTFNASLGDVNKNHFDDGGFSFLQNTVNANFTKAYDNIMSGFSLAAGAEFRYENYQLFAGEEASWKDYNSVYRVDSIFGDNGVFEGLDSVYRAGGAQGFPGYQPSDEVNASRTNIGAYVDAELDVTERFLVGTAVRFENYSDFGFTANGKLASRFKVTDNFNLRGSVSSGYRAPSLQQINFSSTFTTVQGGNISEVKIAPNYSPITKAAGIPELKQERSVNASIGFAYKPVSELSITVDGYWVQVKDRVVLSGQFDASDTDLNAELVAALSQSRVALAQFFANAVNTTNKGIDVVVDYNKRFDHSYFKVLLTGNVQEMTIDKINIPARLNNTDFQRATFLSDREQAFILASAPPSKFGLNVEYGYKNFTVGTRLTRFGEMKLYGYGDPTLGISPTIPKDDGSGNVPDLFVYSPKIVTDLYFGYKFMEGLNLYFGADNLFNVHPDLGAVPSARGWAYNGETGGPWDAVQMGGNGLRLFARLAFNF